MNGHDNMKHDHCFSHCLSRLSWTAVIVGALVGMGIAFLLNLFNIAIGLSIYSMKPDGAPVLAIGGLLGMAIGVIVSMFTAGCVAGYLGRPYCLRRNLGVMYGFVTWCVALFLTVVFTTHMGRYITSYSNYVTNPNPTVILVTDEPATVQPVATSSHHQAMPATAEVTTTQAASAMSMAAFIVFGLFVLGAFFACLGGHCGMRCKRCDDNVEVHDHK